MLQRITTQLGCQIGDVFPGGDAASTAPVVDPLTRLVNAAMRRLSPNHQQAVLTLARALGSGSASDSAGSDLHQRPPRTAK